MFEYDDINLGEWERYESGYAGCGSHKIEIRAKADPRYPWETAEDILHAVKLLATKYNKLIEKAKDYDTDKHRWSSKDGKFPRTLPLPVMETEVEVND